MSDEYEGPTEESEDDIEIELTDEELGDEGGEVESFDHEDAEEEPEAEEPEEEEEEEEEDPEEEDPEEEEPKPKRVSRTDKNVAELRRRTQEAELRAEQYERQLAQEAQLRAQSDAAMMTHYENNLETKAKEVKRRLLEAKSLGDSEAEIDAQSELFQIQSDITNVQAWKSQQAQAAPQARPVAQPQQEQQVDVDPSTQQWIQKNEWFQPNSRNFDPEMHEEATLYARRIERRYRAEGRADEIGSTSYFREIDKHIKNEFPDAFEGMSVPKKGTPRMSGDNRVAPVTRAGQPGQASKPNGKVVKLSVNDRRLAHSMAASGAYTNPNGSRMTKEQAERHHAIYVMKQNRR